MTFADDNKVILTKPNPDNPDEPSNLRQVVELKNTLGQMNCISKDSNTCVLDSVQMMDGDEGNFGASFEPPVSLAADISDFK